MRITSITPDDDDDDDDTMTNDSKAREKNVDDDGQTNKPLIIASRKPLEIPDQDTILSPFVSFAIAPLIPQTEDPFTREFDPALAMQRFFEGNDNWEDGDGVEQFFLADGCLLFLVELTLRCGT
jgi:hypothetical protein